MTPAIAEYPTSSTTVRVAPATNDETDSGSNTLRTIWPLVAPIACAASTRPTGTSRSDDSTTRA